jgi:hypothetical protein
MKAKVETPKSRNAESASPAIVAERIRVALDVCRWAALRPPNDQWRLPINDVQASIEQHVAGAHQRFALQVMGALSGAMKDVGAEGRGALKSVELALGKMLAACEVRGITAAHTEQPGEHYCGSFPGEHEEAVRTVLGAMKADLGTLEVEIGGDGWRGSTRKTVTTRWTTNKGIEPPRLQRHQEKAVRR